MSNLKQRSYYKIFSGTNQQDGYDKIHLGYESETSEITFKKDDTTYFHVPFFSTVQNLANSTLIGNGAIPGPIPAMADRIYKKLANYGKNTPWGNTSQIKDGTWLCSWLYSENGSTPVWVDRYFDPGRLSVEEALAENINILTYVSQTPIFYDVPTQMTLEPGVWYQYYHQGEHTNHHIVNTYSGLSGDRIRLKIEDWSNTQIDQSLFNNRIIIDNFKENWIKDVNDTGFLDRSVLNFENTDFINARVIYDTSYNLTDEFTLSFWIHNKNWSTAPYTQLAGNLSREGYGVFYNNLKASPYFAIPETNYGHLFYFNQDGELYFEKNIQQTVNSNTRPVFSGLNSNFETIVVDISSQRLYKYNHLGDVIDQSKTADNSFYTLLGIPKETIIDSNNNTHVITTSGYYIFDQDLFLTQYSESLPYAQNEKITFDANGSLVRESNCLDIKFDSFNNKWVIGTNNKLYLNDTLFSDFIYKLTNLAIDPENNLWVLTDTNNVLKLNTYSKKLIATYTIGTTLKQTSIKSITFLNSYNRQNNNSAWYALILINEEQNLYQVTLEGNLEKVTYLPKALNTLDPLTANQDPKNLTFDCQGDFTGYEWKRIFNKILFNNKKQLQFTLAAKLPTSKFISSKFNLSVPIDTFINDTWYLITCTYKNSEMNLYINENLLGTKQIPKNYKLTYEYKNDFYIGCPCGKADNLNIETNSNSIIWNGYIDSIRIYNYSLEQKRLVAFLREKIQGENLVWNIPTAPLQYIETIERFFKHKMPGSKSPFYNLKLSGLKITDQNTRNRIEEEIKRIVSSIQPAYTKLLNVEWLD